MPMKIFYVIILIFINFLIHSIIGICINCFMIIFVAFRSLLYQLIRVNVELFSIISMSITSPQDQSGEWILQRILCSYHIYLPLYIQYRIGLYLTDLMIKCMVMVSLYIHSKAILLLHMVFRTFELRDKKYLSKENEKLRIF